MNLHVFFYFRFSVAQCLYTILCIVLLALLLSDKSGSNALGTNTHSERWDWIKRIELNQHCFVLPSLLMPLIWDSRKCEGTISQNVLFRHLPHRYTHSGTFTKDKSPPLCAFALFRVCHLWIHTQNFQRPPHRNFLSSAWESLTTTGTFKAVDYFGERQLKSKLSRKKGLFTWFCL